jgi:hypothetical protein
MLLFKQLFTFLKVCCSIKIAKSFKVPAPFCQIGLWNLACKQDRSFGKISIIATTFNSIVRKYTLAIAFLHNLTSTKTFLNFQIERLHHRSARSSQKGRLRVRFRCHISQNFLCLSWLLKRNRFQNWSLIFSRFS